MTDVRHPFSDLMIDAGVAAAEAWDCGSPQTEEEDNRLTREFVSVILTAALAVEQPPVAGKTIDRLTARIAELEAALDNAASEKRGWPLVAELEQANADKDRLDGALTYTNAHLDEAYRRNAELEAEWRAANDRCDRAIIREGDAVDRAVKGEAERDRLKAALKDIARQMTMAEHDEHHPEGGGDVEFAYDELIRIARATLSDPSGEQS